MENTAYGIIADTLAESKGIPTDKISEDSRFIEDLGIGSLDIVILLSGIEDKLGIEVSDEALLSMKTVGTAAVHIASLAGIPSGTAVTEDTEKASDADK